MIRLPKSLVAAVAGASFFTSVIGDAMACPPRGGGGGAYRPVQYYQPQYYQPQACQQPVRPLVQPTQPALTQEQLIQQQMLGGQFPQQTQQGQFAQTQQGQFPQTQQGQFGQQPMQGQFGQQQQLGQQVGQQQFRGQQSPSLTIQNGGQVAGGQVAGGQVAGGQVTGGQVGGQVAGGQPAGGQVAGGQPAGGQSAGGASASALNALGGSGAAGQQVQQQPMQSQQTQSQQIQSQPAQSQQLQTQQTQAQPVQNTGAPAVAQNNAGTPAADKSALDMALEALMGPTAQTTAQEVTIPTSAPVGEFTSSISTGAQVRLSLRADNSFTWVAAKGEKQNTFQGSYSLAGNALTLVRSDNTKLEGTLTQTTAGFQLKLAGQNDNGLSFVRAAAFASR